MKFIRLPGLIAFIVLFGCIFGGAVFFAESLIENYAENALTEANGAKVDIDEVVLRWDPLTLKVINIEVTDKQRPMFNTAQIQQASFVLSVADLLLGKVNIDELSVTGIKLDTPRKTSGAIAIDKKKAAEEKIAAADAASFEMPDIELPDVKELLKTEPLKSETIFKTLDEDLGSTKTSWSDIKKDLEDKKRWDAYDARYKQIQKDFKGSFTQKLTAIKSAKELSEQLKGESTRFKTARDTIKADLDRIENEFREAKAAPGNDLKRIKDRFNLDNMTPENISQMLFGPQVTEYAVMAKQWYARIEPYLEDDAAESEAVKHIRSEGVDVKFAEHDPKPDFFVRLAAIDIETPRGLFDGSVSDISSDQSINKKPMRFKLSGKGMNDRESEQIDGEFNYVDKNKGFSLFNYQIAKQQIRDFSISKSKKFALNMQSSLMDFKLSARLQDKRLKGNGRFEFNQVDFQTNKKSGGQSLSALLADSFAGIDKFNISTAFDGSLHDLNINLKSDIDDQLGDQLKLKFKDMKKQFENELKAEIDKKLQEPLAKIEAERQKLYAIKAEVKAKEKEYKDKLASLKQTIDQEKELRKKQLDDLKKAEIAKAKAKLEAEKAKAKAKLDAEKAKLDAEKAKAQAKLDAEKKAQQEKIEAEKKKQQDKAKEQLKNKLKKLF